MHFSLRLGMTCLSNQPFMFIYFQVLLKQHCQLVSAIHRYTDSATRGQAPLSFEHYCWVLNAKRGVFLLLQT